MMEPNRPKPSLSQASSPVGRALLVDDDRMALSLLSTTLEDLGFKVETATNGAEAFALLREDENRADIVITDRMMPIMDGLALTRRLKRMPETAHIPVILLTGAKEVDDISAGLEAGAFYYLAKPVDPNLVSPVVHSAMREVQRRNNIKHKLHSHQTAFRNIEILRMRLSLPEEVEAVCSLLASMHDQPDTIVQGIYELVQNAIEHGLLGFNLEEKAELLAQDRWQSELHARSRSHASFGKSVEVTMVRKKDMLILQVEDPGAGFNWRRYINADPSRSSTLCGRGIARANTLAFDKISYNEKGNKVTAAVKLEKELVW